MSKTGTINRPQTDPMPRIRELEAQVERLSKELSRARNSAALVQGRLVVAADELPVDYHGHLPRQVALSLRPDLRRLVMGLYQHLRATHATIRHPRYHEQTKHVDDLAQAIVWVLERVTLAGKDQ